MTNGPLRFTFVIARYGADVLGGAERLARTIAERLAARGHSVRVLTSCARSYVTWENEFAPGTTVERGVEIHRFRVRRGRMPGDEALKWLSSLLPAVPRLARAWALAQGPLVPELVAHLPDEAQERDLLVFFQLLAYPTLFGMPAVAYKSVLVPLVHLERGVNTALARHTLALPRALFVNTEQEAVAIAGLTGPDIPAVRMVGVGLEAPAALPGCALRLPRPYVTCMGRAGKLKPLLRTWRVLTRSRGLPALRISGRCISWSDVDLVIVGERSSSCAALPNVIQTGYVDDATRWEIVRGSAALINPSLHESLARPP